MFTKPGPRDLDARDRPARGAQPLGELLAIAPRRCRSDFASSIAALHAKSPWSSLRGASSENRRRTRRARVVEQVLHEVR
jgi:hypothetical protein